MKTKGSISNGLIPVRAREREACGPGQWRLREPGRPTKTYLATGDHVRSPHFSPERLPTTTAAIAAKLCLRALLLLQLLQSLCEIESEIHSRVREIFLDPPLFEPRKVRQISPRLPCTISESELLQRGGRRSGGARVSRGTRELSPRRRQLIVPVRASAQLQSANCANRAGAPLVSLRTAAVQIGLWWHHFCTFCACSVANYRSDFK